MVAPVGAASTPVPLRAWVDASIKMGVRFAEVFIETQLVSRGPRILVLANTRRAHPTRSWDIITSSFCISIRIPKIMAQKILAFVARSFDPKDQDRIDPIIKFLDSFKSLGFIPE